MTKFSISIPQPCHEKWETFRPVPGGGYCASCTKVVKDFTSMSSEEIQDYFKSLPKNTCGRLRADQLRSYDLSQQSHAGRWVYGSLITTFLTLFTHESASALPPTVGIHVEEQRPLTDTENISEKADTVKIRGRVILSKDQSSLPGVNVQLKNSKTGTSTNGDGEFEFAHPLKAGDTLLFTFIGLRDTTYIVSGTETQAINIVMQEDLAQLSEIVYAGGICVTRTISPRRWWGNLKYWLRRKS